MAQRAETTVAECVLISCVWARFRTGSHTMPGHRHNQPTPTSWAEMDNVMGGVPDNKLCKNVPKMWHTEIKYSELVS